MAARHFLIMFALGCISISESVGLPIPIEDPIPIDFEGPSGPVIPMVQCSVATSEMSCSLLNGCVPVTAFPAASGACEDDFDFSADKKEYVGCNTAALLCTQALQWAVNNDGEAFLFTNGCIAQGFSPISQEEACSGSDCSELPGDLNGDCVLNIQDITALIPFITNNEDNTGGCANTVGDLNMDNIVNILDVTVAIECVTGSECITSCDGIESTFACGPAELTNGLTCSLENEACQEFIGGICGGSPKLPNGQCQVGCSDCGGTPFELDGLGSCACPSYSCVTKLPSSQCGNNGGPIFNPCFCSEDPMTGAQEISCFGA